MWYAVAVRAVMLSSACWVSGESTNMPSRLMLAYAAALISSLLSCLCNFTAVSADGFLHSALKAYATSASHAVYWQAST